MRPSAAAALAIRRRRSGEGGSAETVESVAMPLAFVSPDEYCQVFSDVAWKTRIATLSDAQLQAFGEDVDRAVGPYLHDGRLQLTGASLCASGVKR